MANPDDLYNELNENIANYLKIFIHNIPKDPIIYQSTKKYHIRVKAYCVICHASFEEYFEKISLTVLDNLVEGWINTKKINIGILSLTSSFSHNGVNKLTKDDYSPIIFDYIRENLINIKREYSNKIDGNNGISAKYLKKMLIPIGINLPTDPSLLSSLEKLANERGDYAHKMVAKQLLAPDEAKIIVQDCLKISFNIKEQANKLIA